MGGLDLLYTFTITAPVWPPERRGAGSSC